MPTENMTGTGENVLLVKNDANYQATELFDLNTEDTTEEPKMLESGLGFATSTLFLVSLVAGAGFLALPKGIAGIGWPGFLVLAVVGMAAAYGGSVLGQCWLILRERDPEMHGLVRYPYPAIGEKAGGRWLRLAISATNNITVLGSCTSYILLASENLESLLSQVNVNISFCLWMVIVGAVITPFSWLRSPKDAWLVAIAALGTTVLACILVLSQMISVQKHKSIAHTIEDNDVTFNSVAMAIGTITYAFGGSFMFPSIQTDMKEPRKFSSAVYISYIVLGCLYLPVAITGYVTIGGSVDSNLLQSLPTGGLTIAAQVLLTVHVMAVTVLSINPLVQELEELFKIPIEFTWKRCLLRSIVIFICVFLAETVPRFGGIVSLIGGSVVVFSTFVAPMVCHLLLCNQKGDWEPRVLPLHYKIIHGMVMGVGSVAGILATISAMTSLLAPGSFSLPCYINATAASG